MVAIFCWFLLQYDPSFFWRDDYQSYQLAGFRDVARACHAGEYPLVSPFSWQGGALAAEYQYGVFSAFLMACILIIFPLEWSLPATAAALSIVHLVILATGAFHLGRSRKLSVDLSLLVALVTTLGGWIFCWGARCWFPALASFAWLPWFWWSLHLAERERLGWLRFLPAGGFLYLIITTGWPFTVLMGGVLTAWFLLKTCVKRGALTPAWPLVAVWAVALGLSAPAWLMLIEYTQCSVRGQNSPWSLDREWVVPLDSLWGLIFPLTITDWNVYGTTKPHACLELAGGLVPLAILVAAPAIKGRSTFRDLGWEAGLCLLLLLLCLLPSLGNFRWSFRWLPFFFLVLALLAAETLAKIRECAYSCLSNHAPHDQKRGCLSPGAWSLGLMSVAWILALCTDRDPTRSTLVLGGILTFLCLLWAAVDLWSHSFSLLRTWMPCTVVLLSSALTYVYAAPFEEVPSWRIDKSVLLAKSLDAEVCYLSVYSKPDIIAVDDGRTRATYGKVGRGAELLPGNLAMYPGVRLVNGYSPLKPAGLTETMGFDWHGYLSFEAAEELLLYESRPEGLLEMIAVDGLVVADRFARHFPALERNGWHRVTEFPGGSVFHREGPHTPRVRAVQEVRLVANPKTSARVPPGAARPFLVQNAQSLPTPAVRRFARARCTVLRESRNMVQVAINRCSADQAMLIAFSRAWYPGYEATFNGQAVPVHPLNRIMPAVELPPGPDGVLTLRYHPRSLLLGCRIAGSSCGVVGLLLLGAAVQRRRHKASSRPDVSPQTDSQNQSG